MIKPSNGRALAFVVLTVVLTLISGFAAYQLRPLTKAVAVVSVSDGALEELIPNLVPDFDYTPPTADGVAAWLNDNTVESAQMAIARGNELTVTVWDKDASEAVLRSRQLADRAVSFFDNYRRNLMQDINAWFDAKIMKWSGILAARPPNDEQKLLDIFKTAQIAAVTEACLQNPMQVDNAGRRKTSTAETGVIGYASVNGELLGKIGSYRNGVVMGESCRSVMDDLHKLLAVPPADDDGFIRADTMHSSLVRQKFTLIFSEAWNKPVAWLKNPGVTADYPAWARLPFVISGVLILSMLAAGFLMALYSLRAVPCRGQAVNDQEDEQIFSDPHWPAKVPQA